MGVAYYPAFENDVAGYEPSTAISGKALARAMDELDAICGELGVRTLMSFYSESNAEAFAKIGEPVPPGMKEDPIQWSEPADGLRTIEALLECDKIGNFKDGVIADLESLQEILQVAIKHSTRFRLRIDV